MIINKIEKQEVTELAAKLSTKLCKDPMFMYLCPVISDRQQFINVFFNYYLYEWADCDTLLCNDDKTALVTLINPRTFEYRFKGKGAHALKKQKTSHFIFDHRETVRGIVHIVAPGTMNPRVLTVYANTDTDLAAVSALVDEAVQIANENNLTLVYESFSQRLIELMERKGFSIAYQRRYGDTQFIQTLMTYSCFHKVPKSDEIV